MYEYYVSSSAVLFVLFSSTMLELSIEVSLEVEDLIDGLLIFTRFFGLSDHENANRYRIRVE